MYWGADKSLARLGRKQATATEDFDVHISYLDVKAPGGEKWEHLKSGGKQWQATPKNLPRMQRTRAIPVV